MHTIFFLCRPKPGVSLEEYLEHYHGRHYEVASALPGLVSYRQMPIRRDGPRGDEAADYESLSEYVFEDDAAAAAAWESPEGQVVLDDTGLFMDWDSVLSLPVRVAKELHRGESVEAP